VKEAEGGRLGGVGEGGGRGVGAWGEGRARVGTDWGARVEIPALDLPRVEDNTVRLLSVPVSLPPPRNTHNTHTHKAHARTHNTHKTRTHTAQARPADTHAHDTSQTSALTPTRRGLRPAIHVATCRGHAGRERDAGKRGGHERSGRRQSQGSIRGSARGAAE